MGRYEEFFLKIQRFAKDSMGCADVLMDLLPIIWAIACESFRFLVSFLDPTRETTPPGGTKRVEHALPGGIRP